MRAEFIQALGRPDIEAHRWVLVTSPQGAVRTRAQVGTLLEPGLALRAPRIPEYDECLGIGLLLRDGPMTRAELERAMPISRRYACEAIKRLDDKNLIIGRARHPVIFNYDAAETYPADLVVPLLADPPLASLEFLVCGPSLQVGDVVEVWPKGPSKRVARRRITHVFDTGLPDGRVCGRGDIVRRGDDVPLSVQAGAALARLRE